jgi:hypothetical protein
VFAPAIAVAEMVVTVRASDLTVHNFTGQQSPDYFCEENAGTVEQ